jgi:hypothetical protein
LYGGIRLLALGGVIIEKKCGWAFRIDAETVE